MTSIPFVAGSMLSSPVEGPVIVGNDGISRQFCQFMKASFKIDEKDILADMVVFWREVTTEDETDVELQQIALTRVEVDGYKLTDDELLDFASAYEGEYMETLEWIALSSIDSAATLPC